MEIVSRECSLALAAMAARIVFRTVCAKGDRAGRHALPLDSAPSGFRAPPS
jgi:hypothetical protein